MSRVAVVTGAARGIGAATVHALAEHGWTVVARLYGLRSGEQFARQQPIERLLHPEEVAALIAWLAGPTGAAITGADLPVDGGLSL